MEPNEQFAIAAGIIMALNGLAVAFCFFMQHLQEKKKLKGRPDAEDPET